MITVNEAFQIILNTTPNNQTQSVKIEFLNKRVLSQNIIASRNQPPFNRAMMDGYAINLEAVNLKTFEIESIQAAGAPQSTLVDKNKCIEIMTGASLPQNTNCVIKYEDTELNNGNVILKQGIKLTKFNNVHPIASDYKQGDILIPANTKINSTHIAVIASQGNSNIDVYKNPKIAVISTGDELVELDQKIKDHQIYHSNSYALTSLLNEFNFTNNTKHHINDNFEKIKDKIKNLLNSNDILIISGGVSMGKFDFIPKALEELGVFNHFHKVKQRPGKPMWYGTTLDGKQVFGLPGNPVSCLTCLRRFVIPSLNKRIHNTKDDQFAILKKSLIFSNPLTIFKAVELCLENSTITANPIENNNSGDFNSLTKSTGFIELPEDLSTYEAESAFKYYSWTDN